MPSFQINDDEWNALVEEPGDIFLAYCAIRRVMDYRTGVAGQSRRISEQMLREVLYVAPCRGRHESGSPTRQRVRSVVDRLLKLGVLVAVGPMVFELPLASRDGLSKRSATNEQPDQQPHEQPVLNRPETLNDAASGDDGDVSATGSESAEVANSNLPPVSGLPTTSSARACAEPVPDHRFPMRDDWMPSLRGWNATLRRNGLDPGLLTEHRLREFRSYWINRPDKYQSQGQWEHELAQALLRAKRRDENNTGANHEQYQPGHAATPQHSHRQRGLSAVDRVRAANAAAEAARQAAGAALDEDGGDVRPPLDVEFWREG